MPGPRCPACHTVNYAEDVHAIGQALGLGRFAIVGWSLGGRTGYRCAGLHPEAVERLVSPARAVSTDPPAAGVTSLLAPSADPVADL